MKRPFKIVALSLMSLFSLVGFTVSTIAWFSSGIHVSFGTDTGNVNVFGGSDADYYESGLGTIDKPYVLSNRIHVYNLAWLQYIGYYNERSNVVTGAAQDLHQCYFVLKNDIDMDGLVIPPIGTNKYPFLGHFSGAGLDQEHPATYKVHNFTISNDDPESDTSDFGVAKPDERYGGSRPDVVGFFGVVGKLPNQTISYDSSIVSLSDFIISDFTVTCRTSEVLIGLAAGYVDGEMSGVKVGGNATLNVNGQLTSAKSTITSKLSDYGLVGYTTKTASSGEFSQELSEYYANYNASISGEGWGGSVNTKKNMQWLYYNRTHYSTGTIRTSSNSSVKENSYDTSDYNINFTTTSSSNPNNVTSASLVYQMRDNSYWPLKWEETDNDDTSDYEDWANVSSINTGYLAGKAATGMTGSPKLAAYPIKNIAHSTGTTAYSLRKIYNDSTVSAPYNASKFCVLTRSGNDWVWIQNTSAETGGVADNTSTSKPSNRGEENNSGNKGVTGYEAYTKSNATTPTSLGLTQYKYESADKPGSFYRLHNLLNGSSSVYGIQFDYNSPSNSSYVSITDKVRIKTNKGQEEYNTDSTNQMEYRIPTGSIDFNLNEDGYVNFFASTMYSCYNAGDSNSNTKSDFFKFFSIYHMDRTTNTSTHISSYSLKEIYKIYNNSSYDSTEDPSSTTNPRYYYEYNSNGTDHSSVGTKGSLVFDVYGVLNSSAPVKNAVYYFEFPLNDGEYAMGRASTISDSTKAGSYLLYLDIAASGVHGTKDEVSAYSITTKRSGASYPIGVDFAPVSTGNNGGETICVDLNAPLQGSLTFNVTNSNIGITGTSGVSSFVYQGSKYDDESFTVTSSIVGPPAEPPEGGERILHIAVRTTGGSRYKIRITDELLDNAGTFNEANSLYEVDSGHGYVTSTKNAVLGLSTQIDLDTNFRVLRKAATLTRVGAPYNEFITTYDTDNCKYTTRTIDVDIETNGTTIRVGVTTSPDPFVFKIGGTQYQNGATYTGS